MKKVLLLITFLTGIVTLSAAEKGLQEGTSQFQAALTIEDFYKTYGKISKIIDQLPWKEQLKFDEGIYIPKLSSLIINIIKSITSFAALKAFRNEFEALPIDVMLEFKVRAQNLRTIQQYEKDESFSEDNDKLQAMAEKLGCIKG